jgi:hypothetical protein
LFVRGVFQKGTDLAEKHTIFDGRVHVYKRESSRYWQCFTFLDGQRHRASIKEDSLGKAKDFAEDWYLTLRGKLAKGERLREKTFAEAADQFMKEFTLITGGDRSPVYIKNMQRQLKKVIPPFLMGSISRTHAAIFSFIAGVIPPSPMLGRSLL